METDRTATGEAQRLRAWSAYGLRWRDIDLGRGKLRVTDSKTAAGRREVDLSPWLREELAMHRQRARFIEAHDPVFATRNGTLRNRSNITRQILHPAIARANAELAKAGLGSIEGVTNHSLRRTFASLLYEAGATPPYVMQQMGHESSGLALEIYTKVMDRKRDTGAQMDALIRGADWAQMGTSDAPHFESVALSENENPANAGLS